VATSDPTRTARAPAAERTGRPPAPDLSRAVLFAFAGEGVLSLMDTLIKLLTARYPILQITFMRFACGSLVALLLWTAMSRQLPTRDALRFHGLRAVLAVVTASAFFYGLSKVPVAEAMALSFLSPLFIALFGVLILKERFDSRIGIALAGGLIGMAVIVYGQAGRASYGSGAFEGAAAITLSAICYALVIILLRARATVDPIPVIVLLQNILPACLLIPAGLWVWTPVAPWDLMLFLLVGCLGVCGHLLITNAFARAEAARLAPIHYTVLLWGIIFGAIFFGDWPGPYTLFGAACIVAATLITRRR
jgi:S-adenosylmethionine uptake transporter